MGLVASSLYVPLAGPPPPYQWVYVTRRFSRLLESLNITAAQAEDGTTKFSGITRCLNRHYYGHASDAANSIMIGSWGKHTRVRPSRDVDMLFLMPAAVYERYQQRVGNRQSQLLQEMKDVLLDEYRQTDMRADGQVVCIPFNTILFEVAPGFRCTDGSILVCDTNDGGRYTQSTAEAEATSLTQADLLCNNNARPLARMMKQWRRHCNVPLKSFVLERLSVEFLAQWPYRQQSLFWYDWMVRDFLHYLRGRLGGHLVMPGTGEIVEIDAAALSRTDTAIKNAELACDCERANEDIAAGMAWQNIFGDSVPMFIS